MARALSDRRERTAIVQGDKAMREAIAGLFTNAQRRIDIAAPDIGGNTAPESQDLAATLASARAKGVRIRLVTEITTSSLPVVRLASELLDVRHVPGLKGAFAVSDTEYLSSPAVGDPVPGLPLIYSNARGLVEQHQYIFETLWSRGEPFEERVAGLEAGKDLPQLETHRDLTEIRGLYLSMVKGAKSQVLLLLPSASAFRRDENIGLIDELEAAAKRGVEVKLVTPVDDHVLRRLPNRANETGSEGRKGIQWRAIPSAGSSETVTVLAIDRNAALTIDERDPSKMDFEEAVGLATLATRDPRVRSNIRFFERSWEESELREGERKARFQEERSRRQAELMQDILTHDVRNYNQIARLNAELLEESLTTPAQAKRLEAIIRAIDGSTNLIDRTKKIGRIMSDENVDLKPMGLKSSFERSLRVVSGGNPTKSIEATAVLKGFVLADELLDEVFTNLISNAAKYSGREKVRIEATQDPAILKAEKDGGPVECWKVSVSDWGRGIPDDLKPGIFRRYLDTAKGSGLGLSIVHALVNERYHGKVEIKDRVQGDYTKGTVVKVWLPRA